MDENCKNRVRGLTMAVRNAIGHVDNDQVADGSKDAERPSEKFNSNLGGGRKGIAM